LILFLLGLFGLLGAAGVSELHRQEHAAAEAFHAKLGPESKVRVRFTPSGLASLHGDLAAVRVQATHFSLAGFPFFVDPDAPKDGRIKRLQLNLVNGTVNGYLVDRFEAELPAVHYDFHKASLERETVISECGEGKFSLRMSGVSLMRAAGRKFSFLKNPSCRITKGRIYFSAVFGTQSFSLDGTLAVEDGKKLVLTDPHLESSFDQPTRTTLLALSRVLFDVDKDFASPGVLTLEQVEPREGELRITGRIKLPLRPKDQLLIGATNRK